MSKFPEQLERLQRIVDSAETPAQQFMLMSACYGNRVGKGREDSHIVADLLMAKLIHELPNRPHLQTLIEMYVKGIKEEWWHA